MKAKEVQAAGGVAIVVEVEVETPEEQEEEAEEEEKLTTFICQFAKSVNIEYKKTTKKFN